MHRGSSPLQETLHLGQGARERQAVRVRGRGRGQVQVQHVMLQSNACSQHRSRLLAQLNLVLAGERELSHAAPHLLGQGGHGFGLGLGLGRRPVAARRRRDLLGCGERLETGRHLEADDER